METAHSPIIFLDIDGVLNSDDWLIDVGVHTINPDNVYWLNFLVREISAKIVITSDWRKWFAWEDLCSRLLSDGVIASFMGKTPVLDEDGPLNELPPRGYEIDAWLKEQEYEGPYVILDDRIDMEPHEHRLIQTNPETGLTEADVNRAIELFRSWLDSSI